MDNISSEQDVVQRQQIILNAEQLIGLYNELIASVKITGDTSIEMLSCFSLVAKLVELKEYEKVILYAKKGIRLAKETGDQRAEMKACLILGHAYNILQQYNDAILYSNKCIDIAKETGDQDAEMNAYSRLVYAYNSLQQYDDVILYSKKCIDIAKETGDQHVEMTAMYISLVHAHKCMNEFENALFFASEGLKIAEKYKKDDHITDFSDQIILINRHLNTDEKSLKLPHKLGDAEFSPGKDEREDYKTLNDNLDQARQTNNFDAKFDALNKLSEYYISKQEYDMAIECQKERLALDIGYGLNDEKNTICCIAIARSYLPMGRDDEALQYYHDGLANKCNNKELQSDCYAGLGDIYLSQGEKNRAKEFYKQAIECCEYIFDRLSQDEHQINVIDKYVDWYKLISLFHLQDAEVKEALLFAERCRARALRERLFTVHGIKQEEASKDYQLQYSDSLSTRAYCTLFYILFFDVTLSIILIQMGKISACPVTSFDENEMKSLINKCYGEMGVEEIK